MQQLSTPHNWKLAGSGEEERNRKLGPFHGMSVEDYSILFYDKILHYVCYTRECK